MNRKQRKYSNADREAIVSARGMVPASVIAKEYGVTRNAIIGVWFRSNLPPIDEDRRYELMSFGQKLRRDREARASTCA